MTAASALAPPTSIAKPHGTRAAWIMLASGWSANQFSALLGPYHSELGLTSSAVTGLFAVYVVGLIPALLIAGPLADRHGRRPVALAALGLNVLSTLMLMAGAVWGTALLLPGRFLTGISAGALLAAGSAWIKELSHSPRLSGLYVSAGFATGGLAAALIAQWAPEPMVTAYVPHVVLGVAAGLLALTAPETGRVRTKASTSDVEPNAEPTSATTDLSPDTEARSRFRRRVLPVAPWVFVAPTIGFVTLPGAIHAGLLFTGVATAVVPGVGLLTARRAVATPVPGLLTTAVGAAAAATAAASGSRVLAMAAAAVLGAGYGLSLAHGLTRTAALAPPHQLARWTAKFWTAAYLGMFTPYVLTLLGDAAPTCELLAAVAVLALVVAVVTRLRATGAPAAQVGRA
ncbi:MFS transporter [Streptomyces sp. NBC_01016]|uniref:MFS transporter n=1 Tax=Streptomyces sp. NBC_01016 TaxID=2903720 RepID=UPI00225321B5|nr:MFS transporter [Streptomyces sp. NBC_01016]MCX4832683.1 MFS transporter [Streptomyces sp. NBC_01016]